MKFEPLIVTDAPDTAILGLKPVMTGNRDPDMTVKIPELVAVPAGVVTVIVPVVAPTGTVTANWVKEAAVTVAAILPNRTVFSPGVVLKPVPKIEIDEPMEAWLGVNERTDT